MAGAPGLQHERTALAWQRTSLSGTAVGALAVVVAAHDGRAWLIGLCAALAVLSGLAAAATSRSGSAAVHGLGGSPWPRLLLTAAATSCVAASGLALALAR